MKTELTPSSRKWILWIGGLTAATAAAAALAIMLPGDTDEAVDSDEAVDTNEPDEAVDVDKPTATQPTVTVPAPVHGWPDTSENAAGVYSWDGTSDGPFSNEGFMHNGYASGDAAGDVSIGIFVNSDEPVTDDGATVVTVAGHDAIYRRIDAQREKWIADIEGTTVAINLDARPGTSETYLAEAHAIIDSMRTEPMSNALGFRLLFTLTTDDWDSG